jgi:hypothetical protein
MRNFQDKLCAVLIVAVTLCLGVLVMTVPLFGRGVEGWPSFASRLYNLAWWGLLPVALIGVAVSHRAPVIKPRRWVPIVALLVSASGVAYFIAWVAAFTSAP